MRFFGDCYHGKRVLLTGHTGFKGSWLALWLQALGAEVIGLALPPSTSPAHWSLLGLDIQEHMVDVRDAERVRQVVRAARPDVVFHLAAQSLVRRSYQAPLETWGSNVMGTANLLQACRDQPALRAIVVVSSDKCYENREWEWGYRESDRLGGHDPYSASKGATELVAASFRRSFFQEAGAACVATARAGNVIGGGDWSDDRLVPDLVRAASTGGVLSVRSPDARRPWQHVLDSLSGYLRLGQCLLEGGADFAQAWNFGPDMAANRSVAEVLGGLSRHWDGLRWASTDMPQPHEARLLYLDSAKARARLGWQTPWSLDDTLRATATWYRAFLDHRRVPSAEQLAEYIGAARAKGIPWAI